METRMRRALLIADYKAFLKILEDNGVPFEASFTDDDLKHMSLADLQSLVHMARDLARTPNNR